MSKAHAESNWTPIKNYLLAVLYKGVLPQREMRILLLISRNTYGFEEYKGRRYDRFRCSYSDMAQEAELHEQTFSKLFRRMVKKNVIHVFEEGTGKRPGVYGINSDTTTWLVDNVKDSHKVIGSRGSQMDSQEDTLEGVKWTPSTDQNGELEGVKRTPSRNPRGSQMDSQERESNGLPLENRTNPDLPHNQAVPESNDFGGKKEERKREERKGISHPFQPIEETPRDLILTPEDAIGRESMTRTEAYAYGQLYYHKRTTRKFGTKYEDPKARDFFAADLAPNKLLAIWISSTDVGLKKRAKKRRTGERLDRSPFWEVHQLATDFVEEKLLERSRPERRETANQQTA